MPVPRKNLSAHEAERRRSETRMRRWVLIGFAVFVLALVANEILNPGNSESDEAYRLSACPLVQRAILEQLPPKAQPRFQPCDSYSFESDSTSQYFTVRGHIEMPNAFGIMNKRNFIVTLFRDPRIQGFRTQAWSIRSAVVN